MNALARFTHQHVMPRVVKTAGRVELCQLFRDLEFKKGAEIGVWTGKFSEQLCRTVPGLQLRCIDPWSAYDTYRDPKNDAVRLHSAYDEAAQRLKPFGCELMRMTSVDAAGNVPAHSLDFVYLDGNHGYDYVREDLLIWTGKIRTGGILAGHDCFTDTKRQPHLEVERAVRDHVREYHIHDWFILTADKMPSFFWVVP